MIVDHRKVLTKKIKIQRKNKNHIKSKNKIIVITKIRLIMLLNFLFQ